jgi:hypothetical protein
MEGQRLSIFFRLFYYRVCWSYWQGVRFVILYYKSMGKRMMNDAELFESLPEQQAPDEPSGRVRLVSPVRDQVELVAMDLDSLLPEDHRARMVWAFVGGLDLEPLYAVIKSRETTVGRPATDPAVLMALWLYATVDGIGSARAIERLCKSSLPYRWICGGVTLIRLGTFESTMWRFSTRFWRLGWPAWWRADWFAWRS